jgi:hypothetical protein
MGWSFNHFLRFCFHESLRIMELVSSQSFVSYGSFLGANHRLMTNEFGHEEELS